MFRKKDTFSAQKLTAFFGGAHQRAAEFLKSSSADFSVLFFTTEFYSLANPVFC
jgi:hypothetical protein